MDRDRLSTPQPRAGTSGLDPAIHLLDAPAEAIARLHFDPRCHNFGSGWFDELDVPEGEIATNLFARRLTATHAHDKAHGAQANCASSTSPKRVAAMPAYGDPLLLKRAQITAHDLVLAGAGNFHDIDRLTIFADDLLPHVLRSDGVLRYTQPLAARIDRGDTLRHGEPMEIEIRACALHACERLAARVGVAPRTLDNWLWHRALALPNSAMRPHRTRTTAY